MIRACLRGFCISPRYGGISATGVVQCLFESFSKEVVRPIVSDILGAFLKTERFFAGLVGGDETQIKEKFQGNVDDLPAFLLSHDRFQDNLAIVSSVLHALTSSAEVDAALGCIPEELTNNLKELARLPATGGYGQVKLLASQALDQSTAKPFNERKDEIRTVLCTTPRKDLGVLANMYNTNSKSYFGLDLMSSLFCEEDPAVRLKAVEVYIQRMYRGFKIGEFERIEAKDVVEGAPVGTLHVTWSFHCQGVPATVHHGYAIVLSDMGALALLQKSWVLPSVPGISKIHILVAKAPRKAEHSINDSCEEFCKNTSAVVTTNAVSIASKNCDEVDVIFVQDKQKPIYLHYRNTGGWVEVTTWRNMRSSFPQLAELSQLNATHTLKTLETGRLMAIFLATSKDRKINTILGRGVSHVALALDSFESIVSDDLLVAFEFIEKVRLTPDLDGCDYPAAISIHYRSVVAGSTERDFEFLRSLFDRVVQQCAALQGDRLLSLCIEKLEVKVWIASGTSEMALKLVSSSSSGWEVVAFQENLNETGLPVSWTNLETHETQSSPSVDDSSSLKHSSKRMIARKADSTYIYDFPSLFGNSIRKLWMKMSTSDEMPKKLITATELVLQDGELVESKRPAGQNNVGMVVWLFVLQTPEHPNGREVIVIGNDVTLKAGTFGTVEDEVFYKASALARSKGIPRVYIACNSGARLGAVEELKSMVQISWVDEAEMNKGFEYLYITDEDMATLPADSVRSHTINVQGQVRHVLDAIVGLNLPSTQGGIGVENLQGSGLIAGETSRAYAETFTLSYITGRSVGIGAYLNRLGQRNIQKVRGPMILTGYQALNKLLGQQVYTTQDQLGGPHIMVPNGVTHKLVRNDQEGVEAILKWLSFVPSNVASLSPIIRSVDSVDRQIEYMPSKSPYDPRHMLAGAEVEGEWLSGFCDEGSFQEYLEGWGKTVVVGRARVGGLPIGIVAVETRAVERHIPADPADMTSRDIHEPQAGQVWYPDSAFKTAQSIRDFNGENLPLVIFANWRGFSGGTRDMFAEILKYGAMIVDALVEYKHPVTIYIPPNGELRGGAWVVLDPKINPEQMEMYADEEARGGILEPPAAAEIVFKQDKHVVDMMHRCDGLLRQLDAEKTSGRDVAKEVKARERLLLPLYRQVAVAYCDLHDRSGRMQALGAIQEELKWRQSRTYLHWRIRRRMQENMAVQRLMAAVPELDHGEATDVVKELVATSAAAGDVAVARWFEDNLQAIDSRIEKEKHNATEKRICQLVQSLPADRRAEVVRDLVGYSKVQDLALSRQKVR
jgi:acetyl-CoA carboxylase/biotin carboxylase 1